MATTHHAPRQTQADVLQMPGAVRALHSFQQRLDAATTKDQLIGALLEGIGGIHTTRAVGLFLINEDTLEFELSKAAPVSARSYLAEELVWQTTAGVISKVVGQSAPAAISPLSPQADRRRIRALIFLPLIAGSLTHGLIVLATDLENVAAESLALLSIASRQFSLSLRNQALYDSMWQEKIDLQIAHDELQLAHAELQQKVEERTRELMLANQELDRLSSIDALTGVYNRRHLEEAMARESERVRRYGIKTTLLIFDMNGLKAINDSHGHLMGDLALKEVAQLLRRTARRADVVARFGGDEFVVLAPHTSDVSVFIRRLTAGLKDWNRKNAKMGFQLSLAVGYATAHGDVDLAAALSQADQMMYANKRAHYEQAEASPLAAGSAS